ncbi:MAG: dipeptidase, partial [bacterium]
RLILANNPEDIRRAFQQKKIAAFIGVEGTHCLGQDGKQTMIMRLNRMEELYKKHGVCYLTLTHFSKNDAATPAMGIGSNDSDGLTDFGKDLVQQMNEIGMLIDLAHVNNQGILDACKISKKPVIVTHTGLKGKNNHPRNISNEALKAIADTGGIVGVMFATHFLTKGYNHPSSQIILEHIDYLVNLVGEDHAAIGSDFDGWIPSIPADMQDATDLIILTQGFLNLGYTHERIKKILGENFLRVWGEVLDI